MQDLALSDGVLTLRALGPGDLDRHLEAIDDEQMTWFWEPGDPERYRTRTPEQQRAGHLRYLEECLASFGPGPKWVFAGDALDQPYVVYVDCDLACPHVGPGQANISYTTHKNHRGQGYATRGVRLACDFLREHTSVTEAHLVVDDGNTGSIRVAERAGGVLRACFVNAHGRPTRRYVIPLRDASHNREVWNQAAQKYVRESEQLLPEAAAGGSLLERELGVLRPVLDRAPAVVHLMSGHGLDDLDLVAAGAAHVVGVDFSEVTAGSAAGRARALGRSCHYVVGRVPGAPLVDGCADLVYTGKGALIWLEDLAAWAHDVFRLLRPGGALFVYEAHPLVPLWGWGEAEATIRPDRSYFARSHINDNFPGRGAVEFQHTMAELVSALLDAGLVLRHLSEHPEPFWRPGRVNAAAWNGTLPNALMMLAERPRAC